MIPGNGSLGPTIWLFVICLFYLLPVIVLSKYIGAWAWLAGAGFWLIIGTIIGLAARHDTRLSKGNKHDG